jgi:hypothetical protein
MGDSLTGHVILIVDPRVGQFAQDLQGALERRGAETLIVHESATAFDRTREFHFSAAVLNYDDASESQLTLIYGLGDIPILLYGDEAASAASRKKAPHVAFARANVRGHRERAGRAAADGPMLSACANRTNSSGAQCPSPHLHSDLDGGVDMPLLGDR